MTRRARDLLYISDLDHTLLRQDCTLSAPARERLTRMLGEGLQFTVASARSLVSIREILGDLPLTLPVVHYNGGFVSEWLDGRHWFIETIGEELARELLALIAATEIPAMISTHDGSETWIFHPGAANAGMSWYLENRRQANDDRPREVEDIFEACRHPIVSITMIAPREPLAALHAKLCAACGERVQTHFYENQYNKPWHWLSIHPARATKANAIERMIETLGKTPEDLVVFGDHDNDVQMFELAGRAVAVANATEQLKSIADQVIGSNEEDSVVAYIETEWEAGE